MANITINILISTLVILFLQSRLIEGHRLPHVSRPTHYDLKFTPHMIPGNFTFDGEAGITLVVLKRTKNLTLHSSDLRIHEEETILIPGNQEIIKPNQYISEEESEFLILGFEKILEPGDYTLKLKFSGKLRNSTKGFYWDSYRNDNNETIYLVVTQFETEFARRAFPCWDEPGLKATFDIAIKHFPNYTALSNMPVKSISDQDNIDGKIWTEFETTPIMSTYLVAFTVSDFVNISNPQKNFSIWSRKNAIDFVGLGFDAGLKALILLEKYTGIKYFLPKLDVISIPGYLSGAMENWGLIVFGEHLILRNNNSWPYENFRTARSMVHEISHQWFGNLVGPAWWEDLWITEGLATYLHSFLTAKVINIPRLMDLSVVSDYYPVFNEEANASFLPLFRKIDSEKEATAHMLVVHKKAAAMMHMLSGLISTDVFQAGIRKVLQKYKFGTITTDEFLRIMQEVLDESTVPKKFDVEKVMKSFISQKGFPIVDVSRDYNTGIVKLTQRCPSSVNNNEVEAPKWWIPINFATNSTLDFSSTFATHWMEPEKEVSIIEGVDPEDWIILNIQSTAHYRVNYDRENWVKIADYLHSDDFSKIHVMNRAKILDDAFWFFKQGELDEDLLIHLLFYLEQETDMIPWYVGDLILMHVYFKIYKKDEERKKERILQMVNPLFKETGEDDRVGDDLFTVFKRSTATYWKCSLDKPSCKKRP